MSESLLFLTLHLPPAIFAYCAFFLSIIANIHFLMQRKPASIQRAVALAELGLLLSLITILVGAAWATKTWGRPWVWEPRLTAMLFTSIIFLAWRMLYQQVQYLSPKKRGAILALTSLLALPSIAFTHLAVKILGGIHPQSTQQVVGSQVEMTPWILTASFILIGTFAVFLAMLRIKSLSLESRIEELTLSFD